MKLALAPEAIAVIAADYIKAVDSRTLTGMNKSEEICDYFEMNCDHNSIVIFNAMISAIRLTQKN